MSVKIYNGNLAGIVEDIVKDRLPKAQYALDTQIMNDMIPYMPIQTGTFQNLVRMRSAALAGTGQVCAATTVYGRYLYEGKKMVDSATGKGPRPIRLAGGELIFRFNKGAKLMASDNPLEYSNPQAEPHWYEAAKRDHYEEWKALVKGVMTNGG